MWRKMMHTWLIGAAVTMAGPDTADRLDSAVRAEDGRAAYGREAPRSPAAGKALAWLTGEPRLEDILTDPTLQLMMRSDGVTGQELLVLRKTAAGRSHI